MTPPDLRRRPLLRSQPSAGGRKITGWEISFFLLVGAIVWGGVAITRQPSQAPIYEWARDEAEERLRRRLQGMPVEFGYNYAALRGEARAVPSRPGRRVCLLAPAPLARLRRDPTCSSLPERPRSNFGERRQ